MCKREVFPTKVFSRGETGQWLAGSPEFRNTYENYIGRSCFVILNKISEQVHQDRRKDKLSHGAQRSQHALSTAPIATTTAAHGHPHMDMTASTRRLRWRAHCNVQKSRVRPRTQKLHCRPICAQLRLASHRRRSTCARSWRPLRGS